MILEQRTRKDRTCLAIHQRRWTEKGTGQIDAYFVGAQHDSGHSEELERFPFSFGHRKEKGNV